LPIHSFPKNLLSSLIPHPQTKLPSFKSNSGF